MEQRQRMVGPVVSDPLVADAFVFAIETDNPGAEVLVEDRGGYIRIQTPQRCRVTRRSLEEGLGRSIRLAQLEPYLVSFAGRIKYDGDDAVIFYLERED